MTAQLRCDEGTVADIEHRIGTLQVEQRAHLDQHMLLSLYEKILAHGKSDMLAATCRWLRKLVADAEVHVQLKLLWEEGQHREAMHHIILELLQLNPNASWPNLFFNDDGTLNVTCSSTVFFTVLDKMPARLVKGTLDCDADEVINITSDTVLTMYNTFPPFGISYNADDNLSDEDSNDEDSSDDGSSDDN